MQRQAMGTIGYYSVVRRFSKSSRIRRREGEVKGAEAAISRFNQAAAESDLLGIIGYS